MTVSELPELTIRPARADELPALRDIERAAGEVFRDAGMAEIADDEPLSLAELEQYRRAGHAWVAVDGAARVAAYLIAEPVDGNLHIEQVSVHPEFARRGIGRALLEHAATVAAADGLSALTLTTFLDVPWNGPYYARCGFHQLDDAELTAGLRRIREAEVGHGLYRWPRGFMRRELYGGVRA